MPSPMQSFNKRKSSSSSMSGHTASAYLTALAEADAKSRKMVKGSTPASTPALSFSSSLTAASSDAGSVSSRSSRHTKSRSSTAAYDYSVDDGTGLIIPFEPPTSSQVFRTVHSEFGHCDNEEFRHESRHPKGAVITAPNEQEPPYYILITTYISYLLMICLGHMRDFFGKRMDPTAYSHLMASNGYAALNSDFDSFYTRRLKERIDDCFSHPVTGVPGRTIQLLDRTTDNYNKTFSYPGTTTRALNVSSYNYLGFAQATGGCADAVEESVRRYGVASLGSRLEGATLDLHIQAEALVARFIGQEDALITSMGFATNSTTIPALVGKGCLVISDELNHASIRFGVRVSGAAVRTFKHNDMANLEELLREVISQGQPKTHRPWKKILIIVEGLYSMEGTMVNLPMILGLKKKYKFYVYVDEAHSIGALGPHGRGVCDYFGIDPRSVDVLMGTFTKSFGAAGGYISGSKALISAIRMRTHAGSYAEAMSPPVLTQVMASIASIMGVNIEKKALLSSSSSMVRVSTVDEHYTGPAPAHLVPSWFSMPSHMIDGSEGHDRLQRLSFNSRYLSRGLRKLGFIVYGHPDSPIVPALLYHPGKMNIFSRLMLERKTPIVVVVVGYPATALVSSRVRFCLSASHTKSDIDLVLRACDEIGDLLDLKHGDKSDRWNIERIVQSATELVAM